MGRLSKVIDALEEAKKLKAYHGSPHDFDEFSDHAIGTGEGAQAYGYGHYFAESEDVAREYQINLGGRSNAPDGLGTRQGGIIARNIADADGDVGAVIAEYRDTAAHMKKQADEQGFSESYYTDYIQPYIDKANLLENGWRPNKGRFYEVSIDASPDELLDWDLPLSEQSDKVQAAMRAIVEGSGGNWEKVKATKWTGGDFYKHWRGENYDVGMSEDLLSSGAKGIRYKDGFSRGAEGGTSNYVIFDPRLIEISKKYGVSIPVAASMLSQSDEAEAAQFEDRINNPSNYPVIENPDGSISTHRMADSGPNGINGRHIAWPTIQMMPDGTLRHFDNSDRALDAAIESGNYKEFETAQEAMDYARGGYKTPEFKSYYQNYRNQQQSRPNTSPLTGFDQSNALDQLHQYERNQKINSVKERLRSALSAGTAGVLGTANILGSIGAAYGEDVIAGLAGAGATLLHGPEEGARQVNLVQEAIPDVPMGDAAKRVYINALSGVERLPTPVRNFTSNFFATPQYLGGKVYDVTGSPGAAAATEGVLGAAY